MLRVSLFMMERIASEVLFRWFAIASIAASIWLFYLLDMNVVYLIFLILGAVAIMNGTLSIRNDIKPVLLGKSLGLAMLFILLNNIGLMLSTLI